MAIHVEGRRRACRRGPPAPGPGRGALGTHRPRPGRASWPSSPPTWWQDDAAPRLGDGGWVRRRGLYRGGTAPPRRRRPARLWVRRGGRRHRGDPRAGAALWLAGSCASPERLREAQAAGPAACRWAPPLGSVRNRPSPRRSSGRPWRAGIAARHPSGPISAPRRRGIRSRWPPSPGRSPTRPRRGRERICDLGYLRSATGGRTGAWVTAARRARAAYLAKGAPERIEGSQCLCNGLMGTIGLAQAPGRRELALVTSGEDLGFLAHLAPEGAAGYTAADVVRYLLG